MPEKPAREEIIKRRNYNMKGKRLLAVLLTVVLLITSLSAGLSAAALVMCETQYTYDSPNLSWLKDMTVKEDMSTINGLTGSCTLEPVAKYPYRETAESFREEVAYYQVLYTLDRDMTTVLYLYMLSLAESFSSTVSASDYSDEFIRSYLESIGIVYPTGDAADSTETKIVARAFFAIITKDDSYTVKRGTGLYEAFTEYASSMLGISNSAILKFVVGSEITDLKQYVLAACKYMLYNAGYKVDASTSESEVCRLIAIMTIRAQGISIDSGTATFEEIKNKYLCAMICKIYDVSVDPDSFDSAVRNDELALYLLRLIGKKNGVTVKNSASYEEAFDLVCKNTSYFNLEKGEFYADIYEYNIQLNYKREKIWVYPQTLGVTSESDGTVVAVSINGTQVLDNYYSDVALDTTKDSQTVVIEVQFTNANGARTSSSYRLNILQGKETPIKQNTISSALSGVSDAVSKVLSEMGLDSSIADIVANVPFELPERFLSIASLLMPNFDANSIGSGFLQKIFGYSKDDSSHVNTDQIGGVGGLDAYDVSSDSTQSLNFNSFTVQPGNLQLTTPQAETTTTPANTLVITDEQQSVPTYAPIQDDEGNWFTDLISDTKTVVVLAVVLVAAFGVCLALFLQIFKEKGKTGKKEKTEKKKTKK